MRLKKYKLCFIRVKTLTNNFSNRFFFFKCLINDDEVVSTEVAEAFEYFVNLMKVSTQLLKYYTFLNAKRREGKVQQIGKGSGNQREKVTGRERVGRGRQRDTERGEESGQVGRRWREGDEKGVVSGRE